MHGLFFTLLSFLSISIPLHSAPSIKLSTNNNEIKVIEEAAYLIDSSAEKKFSVIRNTSFTVAPSAFFKAFMRNPSYNFWITFALQNSGDKTDTLCLDHLIADYLRLYIEYTPGKFIMYKGGLTSQKKISVPYIEQLIIPFKIPAHQNIRLFICMNNRFSNNFEFDGIVLYSKKQFYDSFYKAHYENKSAAILQLLFQGFILCQILYVLFQWFIIRRKEYIYYMLYMLVVGLYFFIKYDYVMGLYWPFSYYPYLYHYIQNIIIIFPYFLYFQFVGSFLEIPHDYPEVNYWLIRMKYLILCYIVADIILRSIGINPDILKIILTVTISILFLVSAILIFYLYKKQKPLVNFVLTGSLLAALGNIIGQVLTILQYVTFTLNTDIDTIQFAQIGILLEISCFTAGLSYKAKKNEEEKIENQKKLIAQLKENETLQQGMQQIRNKIAQDLHDDMGTTLSTILLYSNAALKKRERFNEEETRSILKQISNSASSMIQEMSDTVWVINPKNDTIEKIFNRMIAFSSPLLSANNIDFSFTLNESLKHVSLSMDKRKNVYLIFKEAVNNAVKYSQCTKLKIILEKDDQEIKMEVSDNGKGFELAQISAGNGLTNMQERAKEIGGTLHINTSFGEGTTILLRCALA